MHFPYNATNNATHPQCQRNPPPPTQGGTAWIAGTPLPTVADFTWATRLQLNAYWPKHQKDFPKISEMISQVVRRDGFLSRKLLANWFYSSTVCPQWRPPTLPIGRATLLPRWQPTWRASESELQAGEYNHPPPRPQSTINPQPTVLGRSC